MNLSRAVILLHSTKSEESHGFLLAFGHWFCYFHSLILFLIYLIVIIGTNPKTQIWLHLDDNYIFSKRRGFYFYRLSNRFRIVVVLLFGILKYNLSIWNALIALRGLSLRNRMLHVFLPYQ